MNGDGLYLERLKVASHRACECLRMIEDGQFANDLQIFQMIRSLDCKLQTGDQERVFQLFRTTEAWRLAVVTICEALCHLHGKVSYNKTHKSNLSHQYILLFTILKK